MLEGTEGLSCREGRVDLCLLLHVLPGLPVGAVDADGVLGGLLQGDLLVARRLLLVVLARAHFEQFPSKSSELEV